MISMANVGGKREHGGIFAPSERKVEEKERKMGDPLCKKKTQQKETRTSRLKAVKGAPCLFSGGRCASLAVGEAFCLLKGRREEKVKEVVQGDPGKEGEEPKKKNPKYGEVCSKKKGKV